MDTDINSHAYETVMEPYPNSACLGYYSIGPQQNPTYSRLHSLPILLCSAPAKPTLYSNKAVVERENPRTPAFQPFTKTISHFEQKRNTCCTMSVPMESRHLATETPARGARGQGWRGWFLNSTERCPSRCVLVMVHQRARRLKFLCLGMPCVALTRRPALDL